ncbi:MULTISPECIES: DHH family phosphoesterase [Haloferax]|uniref:DHH/RecJ family phosphoesterase n=2 Tax=Haloferax gibbonsii TaxID=35746 RepID=A0A0K1IRD2_HALGI|nr:MULTISPECIES: DHHA1 domain-containing protein [Haloferax]AKU06870.1 RNA-binding protein [Haloferax gibbonsii]ELZ83410.1 phosphoesterase RecJ domain-containing protein [Haloferax gibbonsii ATCC 33959]MCO8268250.1 DHH family phosphoesterase [Haloferax sp. AB510]QOS10910.1 DHH/RecJ family phosphoesterase [Haloferax gibbonsii]RDZ54730.1 RNA-binding protein [Haloferax sp. Atlit-4N]
MFGPVGQFDTGAIFESIDSFVRAHPEIAAALVVALGALSLVVYAAIRFKRPMGTRFAEALEDVDEVAVLMHPNPDPDAMAAAIGVACLAEQVGTTPTIQFAGQIRHQENRAFRTVLDLDLDPIDHVSDLAAEAVVLVDHNAPRGFAGAEGVLPYAVVDHHPGDGTGEVFTDVRTDYGACSSIIAEYFRDVGAKPVPPDMHASEVNASYTVPSQVATGLVYGILTDTKHLTAGCSAADFDAAGFLFPGVNEDHLDRIANPEVSREVLEAKARAIAGRDVRGPFAVADIGTISNVDAIPQAADELIQLEGVTAAVVCGERESNVYLSGRSRDDRVHMGRTLEAALDHYRGASAGGHARMGGGQIIRPDAVTDGGNGESIARDELIEHVFEALSGDI